MNATTLIQAIRRDFDSNEFRPGCCLLSQEEIISDQKGWNDEDECKDTDFTTAPFWVVTDSGDGPFAIHDDADMDEHVTQVQHNGQWIDMDAAVNLMDDDLRETLHTQMAPCAKQAFFDAYAAAHAEKFGEAFEIN